MTVGVSINFTDFDWEFFVETEDVRVMMDLVLWLNSGGLGRVTEEEVEAADSEDVREGIDVVDGLRRRFKFRVRVLVYPSIGTLRSVFERGRMMVDQKVCSVEASSSFSIGTRGRRYIHSG